MTGDLEGHRSASDTDVILATPEDADVLGTFLSLTIVRLKLGEENILI